MRLRGGALFPRSRVLVTLRPAWKRRNQELKPAGEFYANSPLGEVRVQFREKRYMLNYSSLSFPREAFYEEGGLLSAKMSHFTDDLLSAQWASVTNFLESSVVVTRAYICAMEQTTVLKPELRFFENRLLGKNFHFYAQSESYDQEQLAQEVYAFTQRRPSEGGAEQQQQPAEENLEVATPQPMSSQPSERHTNLCFESSQELQPEDTELIHVQNDNQEEEEEEED